MSRIIIIDNETSQEPQRLRARKLCAKCGEAEATQSDGLCPHCHVLRFC